MKIYLSFGQCSQKHGEILGLSCTGPGDGLVILTSSFQLRIFYGSTIQVKLQSFCRKTNKDKKHGHSHLVIRKVAVTSKMHVD